MFSLWRQAVGNKIAAQAQPQKFYKGNLTIVVTTSVWLQQLSFMKREIIDRMNREMAQWLEEHRLRHHQQIPLGFEPVHTVRFVLGNVDAAQAPGNPMEKNPKVEEIHFSDAERRLADQMTADVADAELREMLARAYLKAKK